MNKQRFTFSTLIWALALGTPMACVDETPPSRLSALHTSSALLSSADLPSDAADEALPAATDGGGNSDGGGVDSGVVDGSVVDGSVVDSGVVDSLSVDSEVEDHGGTAADAPEHSDSNTTPADALVFAADVADAPDSSAVADGGAAPDAITADIPPVDIASVDIAPVDIAPADIPPAVVDAGLLEAPSSPEGGAAGDLSHVDITWMSISNVYYEMGPLRVLTDGYITRIPLSNFFGGRGGLAFTHQASPSDEAAVNRVLQALGGASKLDLLLSGHSHFDHSLDTATWSKLTGATIIGSQTTCFQAMAQSLPQDRCRAVVGGETIQLSPGITMRVVRWNHSGDAVSNPEQHNPIELTAVPIPDPSTGGLHAGVSEDFPNGGGGRGYLFTVDGPAGSFSWFFQNSASPTDLAQPVIVDGVDYGAPIDNLAAAMKDAGLDGVDLWLGTGGSAVAQLVLPVLHPKAYLPIHWDGLEAPFLAGVPRRYSDTRLAALLATSGTKLLTPVEYMDKWRLDRNGIAVIPNPEVKSALGFVR